MSSCVMSVCALSTFLISSCAPEGTHQHQAFASPTDAATPNAIYTQQGAKPACQEDINTKLSHLLLAQLPGTQFTHSKAPNPHASKTSTQNFGISYWHSYPEHNLHTARRQTRMPGRHQHIIFASPIGTATRNTIYTQQGAKPACQEHINTKFSHLLLAATPNTIYTQQAAKPACQEDINTKFSHHLLAQLPGTQFTHSKPPNPHARNTSTPSFRISYWRSYPEHNLHTARRQTRMPGRHPRKILASPIGTATRTQFTHSKAPNPHARNTSTPSFRISYWRSYPEHNLHTARRQTRMPGRHPRKILASPIGTATRTQFTHSKAPNPHARKTSTQNLRISYWRSYPEHNLHTARRQTRMPGRHQHQVFASPTGAATRNTMYTQQSRQTKSTAAERQTRNAKAYIRPRANAPSPTPAMQNVKRRAAAKKRQSVHQTPRRCSKPHACHAKC